MSSTPVLSSAQPLPPEINVRVARDLYLAENGFTEEAYEHPWADFWLFGVRLKIPNLPSRRRLLKLHDLHHVVTGYGTDLAGEGEVSAWELRRGYAGLGIYCGFIVTLGAGLGILVAPRRTLEAWRTSGGSAKRGSLFALQRPYAGVLDMSVAELRQELGVPERGVNERPRALHVTAPRP